MSLIVHNIGQEINQPLSVGGGAAASTRANNLFGPGPFMASGSALWTPPGLRQVVVIGNVSAMVYFGVL